MDMGIEYPRQNHLAARIERVGGGSCQFFSDRRNPRTGNADIGRDPPDAWDYEGAVSNDEVEFSGAIHDADPASIRYARKSLVNASSSGMRSLRSRYLIMSSWVSSIFSRLMAPSFLMESAMLRFFRIAISCIATSVSS